MYQHRVFLDGGQATGIQCHLVGTFWVWWTAGDWARCSKVQPVPHQPDAGNQDGYGCCTKVADGRVCCTWAGYSNPTHRRGQGSPDAVERYTAKPDETLRCKRAAIGGCWCRSATDNPDGRQCCTPLIQVFCKLAHPARISWASTVPERRVPPAEHSAVKADLVLTGWD